MISEGYIQVKRELESATKQVCTYVHTFICAFVGVGIHLCICGCELYLCFVGVSIHLCICGCELYLCFVGGSIHLCICGCEHAPMHE